MVPVSSSIDQDLSAEVHLDENEAVVEFTRRTTVDSLFVDGVLIGSCVVMFEAARRYRAVLLPRNADYRASTANTYARPYQTVGGHPRLERVRNRRRDG
jgi:hypothetical protein